MATNKYLYLLVIQQNFGYEYGWEDVSEYNKHTKYTSWRFDIKEYRRMGYPTRTIKRRVINPQYKDK